MFVPDLGIIPRNKTTIGMPGMYNNRKFKLLDKLSELDSDKCKNISRDPMKYLGISRSTWYRDIAILKGEKETIPVDRMSIYAKFFNCKVDDLITDGI